MVQSLNISMLISKKNEVYIVLKDVEPSTAAELNDFFTFEVPGFKYMPAYRNKMWDGKIRLFSDKTGKIYVGLLDYIKEFCDRNEIDYNIDDDVGDLDTESHDIPEEAPIIDETEPKPVNNSGSSSKQSDDDLNFADEIDLIDEDF